MLPIIPAVQSASLNVDAAGGRRVANFAKITAIVSQVDVDAPITAGRQGDGLIERRIPDATHPQPIDAWAEADERCHAGGVSRAGEGIAQLGYQADLRARERPPGVGISHDKRHNGRRRTLAPWMWRRGARNEEWYCE